MSSDRGGFVGWTAFREDLKRGGIFLRSCFDDEDEKRLSIGTFMFAWPK